MEVIVSYGPRIKKIFLLDEDDDDDDDNDDEESVLISTIRGGNSRVQEDENSEIEMSMLMIRRKEKVIKYRKLIEDCGSKLGYETELLMMVISSLEAIPRETMEDLLKLTGHKEGQISKARCLRPDV
jgi:hypothetical protein